MAYNRSTLEAFAMQAEKMTQDVQTFGGTVHIHEVSDRLSLSREDGRQLAEYLQESGWARINEEKGTLTITPHGYEEIAKLKRHAFWRWVDAHPVSVSVFWAIVSGVIAAVVTHHLLK